MITKVLETTDMRLLANEEWTSAWYEEPWANSIAMSVSADQAGELFLEQSEDGTTVLFIHRTAVSANVPLYILLGRATRYFRIRYRNGASAQTSFLCTLGAYNHIH